MSLELSTTTFQCGECAVDVYQHSAIWARLKGPRGIRRQVAVCSTACKLALQSKRESLHDLKQRKEASGNPD